VSSQLSLPLTVVTELVLHHKSEWGLLKCPAFSSSVGCQYSRADQCYF